MTSRLMRERLVDGMEHTRLLIPLALVRFIEATEHSVLLQRGSVTWSVTSLLGPHEAKESCP